VARADGGAGQPTGERYAPIDMDGASLSGKIDAANAAIGVLNDISVADILAGVVEGTLTVQQALAVILSALAHKADGGGSTEIAFRNEADSVDRIKMIVNDAGDRSASTFNFSDL